MTLKIFSGMNKVSPLPLRDYQLNYSSMKEVSISNISDEGGEAIIFLPINNTIKLVIAHVHITAAIGIAVPLASKLTNAVETAPIPSCIAPINAEAVPAFLLNGSSESAEEFGNAKPCVLRNTQIRKIVEYNPRI